MSHRKIIISSSLIAILVAYPLYAMLYQAAFCICPSHIHPEFSTRSLAELFSSRDSLLWGAVHSGTSAIAAALVCLIMLKTPLFLSKRKSIFGFMNIIPLAAGLSLTIARKSMGWGLFLFIWYYLPLLYVYIALSVVLTKQPVVSRVLVLSMSLVLLLSMIVIAMPIAPGTGDGIGQGLLALSVSFGSTLLLAVGLPMLFMRGYRSEKAECTYPGPAEASKSVDLANQEGK